MTSPPRSEEPKRLGESPYLNRYLWAFNCFMAGWTTAHPVSCICSPTTQARPRIRPDRATPTMAPGPGGKGTVDYGAPPGPPPPFSRRG